MELSPAVRVVCAQFGADVDLVADHIYGFLDVSGQWNLTIAALVGHLHLVQRLSARHPRAFDKVCTEAMDSAAEFGHLEVVQWLHEHRTEGCTTDAMNMAAANGHLKIVQWLQDHRTEGCTSAAMDFAAQNGHLHVVQWLHEHRKEGCTSLAMDNAAKDGHLHVLQWLHANRTEGCTRSAFENACADSHLDVVQWLLTHRPSKCSVYDGIQKATIYGQDHVLHWLQEAPDTDDWDTEASDSDDEEVEKLWELELARAQGRVIALL